MTYDALSWVSIALIIVGVFGLISTILLHISSSMSKNVVTSFLGGFVVCGVVGAVGLGALVFGIVPGEQSQRSSITGINATGQNGILTQGKKDSDPASQ